MEEFTLITGFSGVGGSKAGKDKLWNISIDYLAYKTGGSYVTEEGRLENKGDDGELKRLRGLLHKTSVVKVSGTKDGNSIELHEVLETGIKTDAEANALIEEFMKPVIFNDDLLGEFVMDKRYGSFDGHVKLDDRKISISLDDRDDIATARVVCADLPKLVKDAAAFAADELTELANEWAEEDDEEHDEITEAAFAKRIRLQTISVSEEGNYILWFDDDDLFWGHAVCVYGNTESGFTDATMEG